MDPHAIVPLVTASPMIRYNWKDRGQAPIGYTIGMAVSFAQLYEDLKNGDQVVKAMAAAISINNSDALKWYADQLSGLTGSEPADILRHLFVLLTALGMRESSGNYSCGRDTSANNKSANTAEAGMFQMSWDARTASPLLPLLFEKWKATPGDGLLSIFQQGVVVKPADLVNWGTGDGAEFQRMCKAYPYFAVLCAGVGLRVLRSHWGPINNHAAAIVPALDELYKQVQQVVDKGETMQPPDDKPPVEQPVKPPHDAAWPPAPSWPPLVNNNARAEIYGRYNYISAPTSDNPEGIKITDGWEQKNIVFVDLPQMVKRGLGRGMYFHRLGVNQLKKMWQMWEDAGLLDRVLEFDGSFVARFVRGSRTTLSNHSFGCAFDINYAWNNLGVTPALAGDKGSVRELVSIANQCGFFWGGHYAGRKDGMHFELTKPEGVAPADLRDLKWAQAGLNKLGYGPLAEDGRLGPKTTAALKAFQTAAKITVDGLFGPQTRDALDAALKAMGGPPAAPASPVKPESFTGNILPIKTYKYLIGAENPHGTVNEIVELPWDTQAVPAVGVGVHYRNLLDENYDAETGKGDYGPYLKGNDKEDDVATAYGEGQIDPNGEAWMRNIDDQLKVSNALGFMYVEWDNPDAKGQKIIPDVMKALDASHALGIGVVAKNANLTDNPVAYLKHASVVAHVIEKGAGTPQTAQQQRIAAGKPLLLTVFVFWGMDSLPLASSTARTIKVNGWKGMSVTHSPDGEYTSCNVIMEPLT